VLLIVSLIAMNTFIHQKADNNSAKQAVWEAATICPPVTFDLLTFKVVSKSQY